ncbi:MAG: DUF2827 domain-containing protein [Paludibacterium sp.]|uniref:DUF2827 family protein n=1 Tax=Paludibacterium sp. TaxID=1917523 RepID=UPI0025DC8ECA|nr:DUF2827 family protein [Paludibacterium sp.]MBV8046536.1 DUF2827 domain-containing protein [Paludibacterium sp.]MBV8646765.1 DUF2827 domain-containing protein [Paludibacterium sp.]
MSASAHAPNIGITWYATHQPGCSIWSNGTLQNVLLLFYLLKSAGAGNIWLINGGDAGTLPPALRLAEPDLPLVRFAEVADQLDVLIEGGAQVQPEQAEAVHRRHGIVLAYRCGNDYIMDAERICFNLPSGSAFNGTVFDEIWTQPQHEKMCRSFWELALRAPVRIMPHIWSSRFIRQELANLARNEPDLSFGYSPNATGGKRVAVFEPNLNVVKTFLTPLLICEAAYRQAPQALQAVFITNTSGLTSHPSFQGFAAATDLYRDKKVTFEARYRIPMFLARFTDIVVSHQWENGLNYLYYDVLYGGYPLVHNSPYLRDVGYYYPDFDAEAGARALLTAVRQHDSRIDDYRQQADRLLSRVDIAHPDNQRSHMHRIHALLAARRGGL